MNSWTTLAYNSKKISSLLFIPLFSVLNLLSPLFFSSDKIAPSKPFRKLHLIRCGWQTAYFKVAIFMLVLGIGSTIVATIWDAKHLLHRKIKKKKKGKKKCCYKVHRIKFVTDNYNDHCPKKTQLLLHEAFSSKRKRAYSCHGYSLYLLTAINLPNSLSNFVFLCFKSIFSTSRLSRSSINEFTSTLHRV